MLADIGRTSDESADGLELPDNALAVTEELGDRFFEAGIHRLKGDIILERHRKERVDGSTDPRAEAFYKRALDVARGENAKSWELRAATSLARLRGSEGRTNDARGARPFYDWFSEGHEGRDLSEANEVIELLT